MNDYQAASFLNDDDDFESEQEEFAPTPSPREAALLGDDAVRRVVAQFVNITRWPSCDCPSGQPHKSVRVLFKNGLPYVHCFHPSCVADRATVNAQIADAFRALSPEKKKICRTPETAEERLLLRQKREAYDIARHRLLPELLKNPVPPEHWLKCSPFPVAEVPVERQWKLFVKAMYGNETDDIWMGNLPEAQVIADFKSPYLWSCQRLPFGSHISTCTFQLKSTIYRVESDEELRLRIATSGTRSKAFMRSKRFDILEVDPDKKTGQSADEAYRHGGAVARWVQSNGQNLYAVVDTGNKSLHFWFPHYTNKMPAQPSCPPGPSLEDGKRNPAYRASAWQQYDRLMAKYEKVARRAFNDRERWYEGLRGLGCDRQAITSLTARLPGVERLDKEGQRTGRWQRLLYLDPKFPVDAL
jgi:hypothetical protein